MLTWGTPERHLTARDRGRDQERTRLDAVRDDPVFGAPESSAPFDLDGVGAVRSTSAPICWRNSMRSSTSGSWAAGHMVV